MELEVINYDVIEYHILRTVIANEEAIANEEDGIPDGFQYTGCKVNDVADIEGMEGISLPKSEDGKIVTFKVGDINFKNLKGVHSWKLMKEATQGGPAPLSERKVKECLSYLISEKMLEYRSDKRYYLTPKGASTFLSYAPMLAGDYYSSHFEYSLRSSSEEGF
jgi:hypothetical protein